MRSLNELYQAKAAEKKYSPLKFAWDKFKELGAVPSAPDGKVAPELAVRRPADPMHARHQEYQDLVTKRNQGSATVRSLQKAPVQQDLTSLADALLSQGLHESALHKIQDFGLSAERGVTVLLGA